MLKSERLFRRLPRELLVLYAIVVVTCLLLILFYLPESTPPRPFDPANLDSIPGSIKENNLNHTISAYNNTLSLFYSNLTQQGVFIILSMVILFQRKGYLRLPGVDVDVPVNWLHFILPTLLLFLWLRFGFLLDLLIESRITAWELMRDLGFPLNTRANASMYSFQDAGFLDGYFVNFAREYIGFEISNPVIAPATIIVFGILLVFTHSSIILLIVAGRGRYAVNWLTKSACSIQLWTSALVLGISHWIFAYIGDPRPNPNWLSFFIAGVTIAVTWLGTRFTPSLVKMNNLDQQ